IVFALAAMLLSLATSALAQTSTSSITGVVKDATGALVAGANVVVTNEDTAVKYETTTSSSGDYAIGSVIPGRYTVTVSKPGFQTFSSVHNALALGAPLVVNVDMKVGAATETVQVESTYQRIETTNATVSDV